MAALNLIIVPGNLVVNSFIGMKAMHGSRNVAIANNIISELGQGDAAWTWGAASTVIPRRDNTHAEFRLA